MIYHRGKFLPTPAQRKSIRECADGSFCAVVPSDFGPLPEHPDYLVDRKTITALECVCVTPHDDGWMGDAEPGDGGNGPEGRRAIFWVVDAPAHHSIYLQVGHDFEQMQVGDWVVFDDRVLHCVVSTRKWRACAYQVRPAPRLSA